MVASEASPFAKTGGLADVVGALPAALAAHGWEAAVVLPSYGSGPPAGARRVFDVLPVWLGPVRWDVAIYQAAVDGVAYYLLECPPLYDRPGFYGEAGVDYPDNHIRFAVLCRAALEVFRRLFRADVIHCHDWQAGLVPVYLHSIFDHDPTFLAARTLFTIHNLGYQGLFPAAGITDLGLDPALYRPDALEYWGKISLIKGGLEFSDALGTVSPTYAREIQTPEYGCGLDGVLRARSSVLHGILNGADYTGWNPETDPLIPANYSAGDLAGKIACKQALLAEFGLPPEAAAAPLAGIVSRLTEQKGIGLVADAAAGMVEQGYNLVVLGSGEPEYEDMVRAMAAAWPGRIAGRVAWDDRLAHLIEAGADVFLMPSRYEPCGLNQIYSLRYGTVPVVRATGGLDDTIKEGTGFKFKDFSSGDMLGALWEARQAFADPPQWTDIMLRGMREDFSWRVSSAEYAALYERLRARREAAARH